MPDFSEAAEKKRDIEATEAAGQFITDVDGFVYYWVTGWGGLEARHLRWLADELDLRNAPLVKELDLYFEEERKKDNGQDTVAGLNLLSGSDT